MKWDVIFIGDERVDILARLSGAAKEVEASHDDKKTVCLCPSWVL